VIPFDEGCKVMHVVRRHFAKAGQGPGCEMFQVTDSIEE
jgi:hypothetical protein